MRRNELLAYLIGAGIAGTLLIGPYTGPYIVSRIVPEYHALTYIPFFLLPIAWGVWNWLHVRLRARFGIGAWGAVLGFLIAVAGNLLLLAGGHWFTAAISILLFLPALYYLLWLFIVGPLNDALGVQV